MIRFSRVTKSFGTKRVLNDVSFEIPDGQVAFLIGKSGTGKSVSLKHMVGLLKPDSGTVTVDELDVTSLDESRLAMVRQRCGMVFQFPALLDSLTVYENLAFGLRARRLCAGADDERRRIREALEAVRLGAGVLERHPTELSFGVQKRVSIARTVALAPRHLLFDEPTTGLDPIATNAIHALIRDLARRLGVTAVVVSHDMHGALTTADRILLLDGGSVVTDGTPSEVEQSSHETARAFVREAALRRYEVRS